MQKQLRKRLHVSHEMVHTLHVIGWVLGILDVVIVGGSFLIEHLAG